ncbi:MAG: hypothetical protein HOC71_09220 [Candidatus Latescibacteria bacterium]|jgi:hypothetical protein|nr:hypothetical protein [Candidatus Latescibacterota bacterium]
MTSDINLTELEKKAWMTTHEDGFVDIIIGMLLVNFAVMPVIRELIGRWYILIMVPIPVLFASLLIYFGKRNITAPRIGFVKFGSERKAAQKISVRLSVLSLIVLVVLVSLTALGKFTDVFGVAISGFKVPFTIAVGVVALMSVKARLLGIPRLTTYGFIIGSGVLCVEILRNIVGDPWHNMISWGIPGICILFYGIHKLLTFINKYPLPVEEVQ